MAIVVSMSSACDSTEPFTPSFTGSDAGRNTGADSGSPSEDGGDGQPCADQLDVGCVGGELRRVDTCGEPGSLADSCSFGGCENGACCVGYDSAPQGGLMFYADWFFPDSALTDIQFIVCPDHKLTDPFALVLYNATVSGTYFSVGIRSDLGTGVEAYFQRNGGGAGDVSVEGATTSVVSEQGVQIRREIEWPVDECVTVIVQRAAVSGANDWYDLRTVEGGQTSRLGRVRFPWEENSNTRTSFNSGSGSNLQWLTSHATVADFPHSSFTLQSRANGKPPDYVKTTYNQPNVNISYTNRVLYVETGGATAACTDAGELQ